MIGQSSAQLAEAQLALGDAVAATATLDAGCARGEADALFTAALWRLIGHPTPRNLPAARMLLRRAVEAGHSDAALFEVALTANGTGAPADWRQALTRLEAAARSNDVAAQHLALIQAMNLDADGAPKSLPPAEKFSDRPLVSAYRTALTPQECEHLARSVTDIIGPSTVADPATGKQILHPIRQSDGAVIGPTRETLVVQAINRRLAALTDTPWNNGEPLNILRYGPGQQYRLHSDALPGGGNPRIITAIAYLNHGYQGGETEFPEIGVRFTPRGGDVLVFHNTLPDGRMDPLARHAGLPITTGVKWIATRWIRAAAYDPWTGG